MVALKAFLLALTIHDAIGLLGVLFSLAAYARVQWERDYAKTIPYSLLNFVGAALLIWSICHKWNPAAFLGNLCWALISIYGIYRCLKYQWADRKALALSK